MSLGAGHGALTLHVVTEVSDELVEALVRVLPQVSKRGGQLTRDRVQLLIDNPATTIIVAKLSGQIVGSATLVRLVTLVGQFGYIEEVVVDKAARGQGIGRELMHELVEIARRDGLDFVELTSRPSRGAANRLYQSVGFRLRETNVYRHALDR